MLDDLHVSISVSLNYNEWKVLEEILLEKGEREDKELYVISNLFNGVTFERGIVMDFDLPL